MNNTNTQNSTTDISDWDKTIDFEEQKKEIEETDQLLSEISSTDFENLKQKYSLKTLSNLISKNQTNTYRNVMDRFISKRNAFLAQFIDYKKIKDLNEKIKNEIIDQIASLKAQDDVSIFTTKFQQINTDLTLPTDFQIEENASQAQNLSLANRNIKKIIAEATYEEYLFDVKQIINEPIERINQIENNVTSLIKKISGEYEQLEKGSKAKETIIDEALVILARSGRTPVFIKELKDYDNFGEISDIIFKLSYALDIVLAIRKKFTNQIPEEQIREEVKNYVIDGINLN